MSYHVKLNVFEGPLDLLLFFIKRDEINIYDIPIAYITKEYLQYIEMMHRMNLHLAGEFLTIAAMLMRIKVRMLLPREEDEEEEEIEDPRTDLVQMLLEYKKFKEISACLQDLEEDHAKVHTVQIPAHTATYDPDLFLADVELLDLGIMFSKLLAKLPKPSYYEVERIQISINHQIQWISSRFADRKRIRFSEITKQLRNRLEVVVTFLAILEMVKSRQYSLFQKSLFGDLWMTKLETE